MSNQVSKVSASNALGGFSSRLSLRAAVPAVALLLTLAMTAWSRDDRPGTPDNDAKPPSTAPSGTGRQRGERPRGRGDDGMFNPGRNGGANADAPADRERGRQIQMTMQEADEARNFARDHAPIRYAFYDMLPEGPARFRVLRTFVQRYRLLQSLKEESPEIYAINLQRFEAEDNALGLARNARSATAPAEVAAAKSKLQEKVALIVDLNLQERQKRIDKLETRLTEEKQHLLRDQGNVDELIAKEVAQYTSIVDDLRRRFEEFRRATASTTRESPRG